MTLRQVALALASGAFVAAVLIVYALGPVLDALRRAWGFV